MQPADERFLHRPISVTVEQVLPMEAVRTMAATQTSVTLNLKLNQRMAKELARMLLKHVLEDEEKRVDLVTFSLHGTMK